MMNHKIDFAVIFTALNANPNGDPLNGNRPRETFEGFGEVSDVCIKRKIRNRLQDMGESIFVQSDDRCTDGCDSLHTRVNNNPAVKAVIDGKKKMDKRAFQQAYTDAVCSEWLDVRSFGQVFAFKGDDASVGVRGPVSIQTAVSVSPVEIVDTQITKSVNGESGKENKASDTMGTKHVVKFGLYVCKGSINCQLADATGFTDEDAEKIKQALLTLFENDASSARPEGSMEVCRVLWWKHDSKTPKVSSAKVHRSLRISVKDGVSVPMSYDDYDITVDAIDGVSPENINLM